MALSAQQTLDLLYRFNFDPNASKLMRQLLQFLLDAAIANAPIFIGDVVTGNTYQNDDLVGVSNKTLLVAVNGFILTYNDNYTFDGTTGTITFTLVYDNAPLEIVAYDSE